MIGTRDARVNRKPAALGGAPAWRTIAPPPANHPNRGFDIAGVPWKVEYLVATLLFSTAGGPPRDPAVPRDWTSTGRKRKTGGAGVV